MTPLLSILICSIPSRFDKGTKLYNHILELVGDRNIEVLLLCDNKKRTIGEKREAIKNISRGKYFMFVDDDDSLYSVKEIYAACEGEFDIITFKNRSLNSDGSSFIVTFGLGNEVEHNTEGGKYLDCNRPPFPQCAWHESFRSIEFPSINYGEDWEWVKKAIETAKTEVHIPEVLHGYNFDPAVTEADTNSNALWSNPNDEEIKRCIVNLSTGAHIKGQNRLRQELNKFWGEPVLLFQDELQVGSPAHNFNAYAFKVYAIDRAVNEGYNQVLWLDASVYPVASPDPVFKWLTERGVFFEEAGHYVGQWCNNETLDYFGISREHAMTMPMFSGGFIGLDFRKEVSIEFFKRWKKSMLDGMFVGSWSDHRHDMTCGSIIANQMGLTKDYSTGGNFFAYIGEGYNAPNKTAVFNLRGL